MLFDRFLKMSLMLVILMVAVGCENAAKGTINEQPATMRTQATTSSKPIANNLGGFNCPTAITFDADGNMYVANWDGGTVEKISKQGERSVWLSIPGSPAGLACDKDGNIYVSDYRDSIYKVSPDGNKSVYAKGLHTPTGIAFNAQGELLVANRSRDEIVAVSTAGTIRIVAANLNTPVGVVEDKDGTIVVTNYGGGISVIKADGKRQEIMDFVRPGCGITINKNSEILAIDNGGGAVRKIAPDWTASTVVVGGLKSPVALAVSPSGNIYVGTWGDGLVQQL